jgi:hypothetical protein
MQPEGLGKLIKLNYCIGNRASYLLVCSVVPGLPLYLHISFMYGTYISVCVIQWDPLKIHILICGLINEAFSR